MRKISRILLGLLFVFSGFVKAVDPVGSSLIFKEYFHAFGIGFLEPFSLICGITLSAVEFTLGVWTFASGLLPGEFFCSCLFLRY